MNPQKACEKCKKKVRSQGYTHTYREKKAAPKKHTAGKECQQCVHYEDEIASLQAEIDELRALMDEGLCDGCYDKLHPGTQDLDNAAGEETVVSAPAVSVYEASEVVHASMTDATAFHLSGQQSTSSVWRTLPTGTFGSGVAQRTSIVPASAVIDYCALSELYDMRIAEGIHDLQELCRQTRHVAHVLRNPLVLTVENPLPSALVGLQYAINLDGLYVGAHFSGCMFRVLESFYHLAFNPTAMLPPRGCFRYIKPSNIVLWHDHFPKKAYYSKLSKTYYAQYEPQQYLLAPIPLDDVRFVAPEVLSGHPYDVNQAMAYSVGASLYYTLTVTMGMKHVVTKDGRQHFIMEGTFILHPDGSVSGGLYSVNPVIVDVIGSLLQPCPARRGTLGNFTQLFTPTSLGQMDMMITGAKPIEPDLPTDDVCWPPAAPPTAVSPITYAFI